MAVQSETSLNGNLLLRSVYRVDKGQPELRVYAPRPGETIHAASAASGARTDPLQGSIAVNFDRQGGVSITRQTAMPVTSVTIGSTPADPGNADDLQPLDLSHGPVDTAGGRVSVAELPAGLRARIQGDGIDASHLVGAAFGSVVANTGGDRTIDTTTTISLDLRGATPFNLGSSLLRAEALGTDAVRQMVVR